MMKIGFIGQGFIGKNYANDFENRGYSVIRYALEKPNNRNGAKIKDCDVVFIAVPTPTTPKGFDDSIVRTVLKFVGEGKIAVIKSTLLPGATESIQNEYPRVIVLNSPEFLTETNAAYDAAHPKRNIIGIPQNTDIYRSYATQVMNLFPDAPFTYICPSREAELIKYAGNTFLFLKVVYVNILYDLTLRLGCKWEGVCTALKADPRIGTSHFDPVHKSGPLAKKEGRGAGGHCFIKDFAAFKKLYKETVKDPYGNAFLEAMERKNIELLTKSNKDIDLLQNVYGKSVGIEKSNEIIGSYTQS